MATAARTTELALRPPIERPCLPEMPECPECDRACNREHFTVRETARPTEFITYLYCDHCGVGRESLWVLVQPFTWRIDSTILHRGDNAAAFLRILESLTCVT